MVLQIAADHRRVERGRDSEGGKLACVADAGQHHDLRRVDGAGRQDDLAPGPYRGFHAVRDVFDAGDASGLDDKTGDMGMRPHLEIGAPAHGVQIGVGG